MLLPGAPFAVNDRLELAAPKFAVVALNAENFEAQRGAAVVDAADPNLESGVLIITLLAVLLACASCCW